MKNEAMNRFDLTSKTAIVTGAAQGLGVNMAKSLSYAGANVIVVDVNGVGAKKVANDIGNMTNKRCISIVADLKNDKDVQNMVEKSLEEFGKIDILVNNAAKVRSTKAEDISHDEWQDIINNNLTSTFLCCKYVGQNMIKNKSGVIINVSSISSLIAVQPNTQAHYHAAKGGMNSLTRALAFEWAKYNIRVNTLVLAYMHTPVVDQWYAKFWPHWSKFMPMGRIGEPEEVEGVIIFMASEASSFMTGAIVNVDGGYTLV